MVAVEGIPEDTREHIEQLGTTDVVIGLAGGSAEEPLPQALAAAYDAVHTFPPSIRTVIVHPAGKAAAAGQIPAAAQSGDDARVRLLGCPLPVISGFPEDVVNLTEAYRVVFSISQGLRARACCVLTSNPGPAITEILHGLVEPVMAHDLDLVVPLYARKKFEGLINSSIVYPLTRALYGKRLQSPLSPDMAVSARFMERWLQPGGDTSRAGAVLLMPSIAIREGFQVGQVFLPPRAVPHRDISDLSAVLSQVLDPLFADVEKTAAIWQRTRGSQPVPSFGNATQIIEDGAAADVRRLIDAFQLGYRNLLDVWSRFLPPETLVELKRLTRMPAEHFRLADDYWARIVYDCALGHRLRVISRDHLLRAMTPMYLAWLASYVVEVQNLGAAAVQERLESLCRVFEQQKSYLVSRWRWPDRYSR